MTRNACILFILKPLHPRVSFSFSPCFILCLSHVYVLARACFTSAHKCTLLGVMFSLFPASLSYTETNIAKTSVWQLARPAETHLAYENARVFLASANPVACHEISENYRSLGHNDTCPERIDASSKTKNIVYFFVFLESTNKLLKLLFD